MHFFTAPVIGMRLFSAMRIDVNKVLLEFPAMYARATGAVKAYLQITGLDMHDARNPHACVLHISPSRAYEVIVSVLRSSDALASYKDGGLSQLALSHPLILLIPRKHRT
jgi:hypothetical protein